MKFTSTGQKLCISSMRFLKMLSSDSEMEDVSMEAVAILDSESPVLH